MKKIILSVAPVCAVSHEIEKAALVEDILKSAEEGAAMVHLHVRDRQANLTEDMSFTQEIIEAVQKESDLIIQVSTGGVSDLDIKQRCVSVPCPNVETHSLNVGSVNLGSAVYVNSPGDVEYCVEQIIKYEKLPEVEVFELGMIDTLRRLAAKFPMRRPLLLSVVLGHEGAAPATEPVLNYMVQSIGDNFGRDDAVWGITHAGRKDFTLINRAVELGALTVRLGFEDSFCLGNGEKAKWNWQILREYADTLSEKEIRPATAAEARQILKITL